MGFPLPSKKYYPLAQQVSRLPAHPTTHPSLPTLPTRCLLGRKPEGAREDSKKLSNRPDKKIFPTNRSRKIEALPLPPCSVRIRERQQRSVSLMSRESSDGSAGGGGQEDRLYIYYFLFIPLNFLLPSFYCPSSFSLTNSTKAIALDGSDLMGESLVGWGAHQAASGRGMEMPVPLIFPLLYLRLRARPKSQQSTSRAGGEDTMDKGGVS